jgi:hypothetical protein
MPQYMQQQAPPQMQQPYIPPPMPQPQQHPLSNMSSPITQMTLPGINAPMNKSFPYESYMKQNYG